jgi:hypothetical protein
MEGEAVKKIFDLTIKAMELKEVEGKKYSPISLHRVYSDPRPAKIIVKSLQGIKDYLNNNVDDLDMGKLMIHIVDHKTVHVLTDIHGEDNERNTVISAILEDVDRFPFSDFIGQERFIIKLKSMFVESEDQKSIIRYTAKIDAESRVITEDDGITQNVNVKLGASGVKTERDSIPSLVKLKPFRTFTEINQPESEFLFRMSTSDGKAQCALFDADGGAWKNEARKNISDFFENFGVAVIS